MNRNRPTRVLILSQWFDPEPTFKGLLFAKELQRLGFEVQVLTGFPNYPGGKLYDGYRLRPVQKERIDGIDITRTWLFPSHNSSGVQRLATYMSFALTASIASLLIKKPDIIYVHHPPATIAIPALIWRMARRVPVVYDIQDLWPDTLAATGMVTRKSVLKAVGAFMQYVYRHVDAIVVLSSGFRRKLIADGINEKKISVIMNWADEVRLQEGGPCVKRADNRAFKVLFAGNVGTVQALDVVLGAAERLIQYPDIVFIVLGDGLDKKRLIDEAARKCLKNVRFMDRVAVEQVGAILADADALLVHLRKDPLFEITIPSKTQAYLLAGKPILMGVQGDATDLVRDAGAGLTFDSEDPVQLANRVLDLRRMTASERASMGRAGAAFYREHLSLSVGTSQFSQIFTDVNSHQCHKPPAWKRGMDTLLSAVGLVTLAVPMLAIAAAVLSQMGRPVLFRQERPGLHGVPFRMVKFRTMTLERDEAGELLPDRERLTPFGLWLRSNSLDELPELINVLAGDMSLVGPRPLLMRYTKYFSKREGCRLNVRPGITGLAQINGRNTSTWDERLRLDVEYVRSISFRGDLRILIATVRQVLRREGFEADPESKMQNLDEERGDVLR